MLERFNLEMEFEWRKLGHTTTHYSWAFLAGALPGFYFASLYGIGAGWVTVILAYVFRSRFYTDTARFDDTREQALVFVSAIFCWLLFYLGPLMWLYGWSEDYFGWQVEMEVEEELV